MQLFNFSAHINQFIPVAVTINFVSCVGPTVSRFLSHDAAATLIHAFVTSSLIIAALTLTARLDRFLRSAARLIGGVPKYVSISRSMRDTLHWLPIRQRIFYRVVVPAWHCLLGVAPVS